MNKLLLSGAVLCTGVFAFAQTGFSAPNYIDREEGTGISLWLGRHPDMRHQIFEGEFRNKSFAIRELALRLDSQELHLGARNWTRLTISMAVTDFTRISNQFGSNALGGLTTVFQSKVDWPAVSGFPVAYNPTIWGDITGKLRYPFNTPWQHTGKLDFLTEFVFEGGTMANKATWNSFVGHDYILDADAMTSDVHLAPTSFLPPTRGCVDPGNPVAFVRVGARLSLSGAVYARNFSNAAFANRLVVAFASLYTAPNAPVIHAIGVAGNIQGANVMAACNKLHVDLTRPYVPFFYTTTMRRGVSISPSTQVIMPWNPAFAGMEVWGQSAWSNSKTGAFSLTHASRLLVPARQPIPTLPPRQAAMAVSAKAGVADTGPSSRFRMLPAIFYRTR